MIGGRVKGGDMVDKLNWLVEHGYVDVVDGVP